MISVIMPAYNAAAFIEAAITGIQKQTYQDFELIVVDDGSTDETRSIIEKIASQDPRIKIVQGTHAGVSAALNLGISKAASDWIAVAHADDISLPERLETQVEMSKLHPEVVVWSAYVYHIDSKDRILSISKAGPTTIEEFIQKRKAMEYILVYHTAAFLKKEVVLKAGLYDSRFDGSEELELFDRMAEYGPILAIPKPLALYRIHSTSISMHRFMEMRRFTRYMRVRQKARLENNPLPTYEEFLESYQQAPFFTKWRRYLDDLSQLNYRKAGLAYAERDRVSLVWHFGLSAILNPAYALKRVNNQLFSKQAKELVEKTSGLNS